MIGRQFESDPAGASRRYENPSRRHHNTSRQFWPTWGPGLSRMFDLTGAGVLEDSNEQRR